MVVINKMSVANYVLPRAAIILMLISIKTTTVSAACGWNFDKTYDAGVITTPNYPDEYANSEHCRWNIEVEPGYAIRLEFFKPFDLEDSSNCVYDYVKVYENKRRPSVHRGKFCGTELPPIIISSGSTLSVEYKSDTSNVNKGMSAMWRKVEEPCQQTSFNTTGLISSVNQTSTYKDNLNCTWQIVAPEGQFVQLEFEFLSLSPQQEKSCNADHIEIFDVFANESLISRGRWCGQNIPPVIESFGNRLFVQYKTDGQSSNNGLGFRANWNMVSFCRQEFNANRGYIMSYNHNMDSLNDTDIVDPTTFNRTCQWEITVDEGFRIDLTVNPHLCEFRCGTLELYDVLPTGRKYMDHSMCNRSTSSTNKLLVIYEPKSNCWAEPQEFFASWKPALPECGSVYYDVKGNLSSPGYPRPYGVDLDCKWEINAAPNHMIRLAFDPDFEIEASETGCDYDYIEIFERVEGKLFSQGKFCGHNTPESILSYSPGLVIVFHSDGDKTGKGFSLSWNSEETCGGVYKSTKGNLTFPNVDTGIFSRDSNCRWEIQVDEWMYYVINIDFEGLFDLGGNSLTFRGHDSHGSDTFVTSINRKQHLSIETSNLGIEFRNRKHSVGKGFSMVWEAECGGSFFATQGTFSSPYYSLGGYADNLDCTWTIHAKSEHVVHLYFDSDFGMEINQDGSCGYDHLEVYDVSRTGGQILLGRFCGSQTPPMLISRSDKMMIKFHSDQDKFGRGFAATFDTACGQVFRSNSGRLTSPLFPAKYPNNFDCQWVIEVDREHVIRLTFHDPYLLEDNDGCTSDYLELFDYTKNGDQVKRGRWCGSQLPELGTVSSLTHKMRVNFHSDHLKTYDGFNATWDSVCGDVYHTTEGSFHSPGFPISYPPNMECRWEINVATGQRIKLQFGSIFDLEMERDGCAYDHIEIVDFKANGEMISRGKVCDVEDLPDVTSLSNKLTILFHSDLDKHGSGFNISWTTVDNCHDRFNTASGSLISPNYPYTYPQNQNCEWYIKPPNGENLTLTFDTPFHMEEDNGCAWDYVEILIDGTWAGRWCGSRPPPPLEADGEVFVRFRSDKSTGYSGFHLRWEPSK